MNRLWQGNWRTKARIVSGLILFCYVLFHFFNIGMGLFSLEAMEWAQDGLEAVTSNPLGQLALYGALLTHMGLALYRLARKRTLRMPASEAGQVLLGLLIPLLLMTHIVHTRVAENRFAVER